MWTKRTGLVTFKLLVDIHLAHFRIIHSSLDKNYRNYYEGQHLVCGCVARMLGQVTLCF